MAGRKVKLQPVEVIWWDANFEDEYAVDSADELEPVTLHTMGYLAADTDDALVVAMTYCADDDEVVTEHMVIPWEMVIEWGDLK